MQCYFHGYIEGDDPLVKREGTVSFAIPDIGVIFRSRWEGNLYDCQYAALISLLRFISTNEKLFKGNSIDILSDATVVIYQLTKGGPISKSHQPYFNTVNNFKSKFAFKVKWIPEKDNPACHGLSDVPPFKPSIEINYDVKDARQKYIRRGGMLPI
jgi:hypothetical protein